MESVDTAARSAGATVRSGAIIVVGTAATVGWSAVTALFNFGAGLIAPSAEPEQEEVQHGRTRRAARAR